jgi:hypothetical protein
MNMAPANASDDRGGVANARSARDARQHRAGAGCVTPAYIPTVKIGNAPSSSTVIVGDGQIIVRTR